MISPHLLLKEQLNLPDLKDKEPSTFNTNLIDYSYIFDADILRLMGFDVPLIRRGCPQTRSGVCFYRNSDNYPPKGTQVVPQSLIVPYYRSSVVFNTSLKRNCLVNQDVTRSSSEICQSLSHLSDTDNQVKAEDRGGAGENVRDNMSDNSYRSSTTEGNKGVKRSHCSQKNHSRNERDYQSHKPVNGYFYQGNKWQSGRRSPPGYNVKYSASHVNTKYGTNNSNHSYTNGPRQQNSHHNNNNNNHNNSYGRRIFPPPGNNRHHYYHQCFTGQLHHQHHQHVPPDRFLAKVNTVQVVDTPDGLTNGGEWDQSSFPRYGLFLVGSTMSGFGSDNSDVDMCLIIRHTEMDQRSEALTHLGQVLKYLKVCAFVDKVELIQAKVPILKFRGYGFEVDLNCNNSVGIRNTHMLYCYAQMDWRVRPLALFIKLWAAKHNINDAKKMTVSSYSLSLMVIHFLQCGVKPAVLPCLHSMYKNKFNSASEIVHIDLHEELGPYKSDNNMSLGLLLVEFLRYYAEFDYNTYAISVRTADRIPIEECRHARSHKNDPHQWKYLCIEEPFDLTNTARSVYDQTVFERIKTVFNESYNKIKETHCLQSIYQH